MSEQDAGNRVRPDIWGDDPPARRGSVPIEPRALPPTGQPLDLSQDPDRVQPGRPLSPPAGPFPTGVPLDLSKDPDRVRPGGLGDRTLIDLLGEGAQEESRDTYVWLAGLLAVLVFLAIVAFVASHLGP